MPHRRGLRILAGGLVCLASAVVLAPFVQIVLMSLGTGEAGASLEPYRILFEYPQLGRSILVTVGVTTSGTLVSIIATALAAYALSRPRLPGARLIRAAAYVPLLMSAGLIPLYVTVRRLGLVDTLPALILPFCVNLVNLHVLLRYFHVAELQGYEEAASLEGAGAWRILASVVLPASAPALITVGLFYAISYWNSWFPAFLFTTNRALYPYQLIVRELTVSSGNALNTGVGATTSLTAGIPVKMAAVVLGALPAIPFVVVAQSRLRETDLLAGIR